ncbi:aKG-HExxH-type peptide beta-hydroxylase, partial [Streptomyces sp. NPDC003832]
ERYRPRSASASEAFGCVMVSAPGPGADEEEAAVELAVTLVHEFRHTLLNGLMHLTTLAEDCPDLFHAPWRDDPRPLSGVLHGAFAFSGVARFWRDRAARTEKSAAERARFEFALWRRESRATLEALRTHPALTGTGRRLVAGLLAGIRSWDTEPVPEHVLLLAERAAAHQRAGWRAHHVLPDEAMVRALADSWLDGAEPTAAPDGGSVVTDPAGCRLDAFAHLVRLRITDPDGFAEARNGGPRPKDVTSADLAYVAGDLAEATALYATQTHRPASWGALALIAGGGQDGAAGRPEVLRAVSRAVTRRSGHTPPPAELAGWLGGARAAGRAHNGSGSTSQLARSSQDTA